MPNWCANTIEFHGITDERFNEIWADFYNQAQVFRVSEGIHRLRKLFILIYTGAVRVSPELYFEPPLVNLTVYGGAHIDTGREVDTEVSDLWRLILNRPRLTDDVIAALARMFLERQWECSITMEPEWLVNGLDFADEILRELWMEYDPDPSYRFPTQNPTLDFLDYQLKPETPPKDVLYHSLFTVLPPRSLNELNGYGSTPFKRAGHSPIPQTSRQGYLNDYETKWASMWNSATPERVAEFAGKHCICGDTAWTPFSIAYLEALAAKYDVSITHYYCEQGLSFCGTRREIRSFRDHQERLQGHLTDDEEDYIIDGPEWAKEKMENYGG